MRHGLWHRHPGVRSGDELTLGERAADLLKHWFGTWTALGFVFAYISFWWFTQNDPGHLNLNLTLSCVAAVQGIILQISANRGDRISSEVALHTQKNTEHLVQVNDRQLQILSRLEHLDEQLDRIEQRLP